MPNWKIEEESKTTFILLPSGVYRGEVKESKAGIVMNGMSAGSDKIEIKILVDGKTLIKDNLINHEKLNWKASQFFTAAGLARVGENKQIEASDLLGAVVVVKVSQKEIIKQNGSKMIINQIEKYTAPASDLEKLPW